jgi:hypothetical protein
MKRMATRQADPDSETSAEEASELLEMLDGVEVRKRSFLSHLYIKTIILPRQARDKHRETLKKMAVFLQEAQELCKDLGMQVGGDMPMEALIAALKGHLSKGKTVRTQAPTYHTMRFPFIGQNRSKIGLIPDENGSIFTD